MLWIRCALDSKEHNGSRRGAGDDEARGQQYSVRSEPTPPKIFALSQPRSGNLENTLEFSNTTGGGKYRRLPPFWGMPLAWTPALGSEVRGIGCARCGMVDRLRHRLGPRPVAQSCVLALPGGAREPRALGLGVRSARRCARKGPATAEAQRGLAALQIPRLAVLKQEAVAGDAVPNVLPYEFASVRRRCRSWKILQMFIIGFWSASDPDVATTFAPPRRWPSPLRSSPGGLAAPCRCACLRCTAWTAASRRRYSKPR